MQDIDILAAAIAERLNVRKAKGTEHDMVEHDA